ncbi:MAG: 5'/3'-nucleotidase SurE [Planctomycetes bacterium]|nr:5'/3'-nucleotidase SurE [Planctomycetota bacterium]
MTRPRILLTNDDGVHAAGLLAAYEALSEVADVTVVAPTSQCSGFSHKLTLDRPLRAYPLRDLPGYRVEVTPVDCVKVALKELLPEPPDLVVSGINRGLNAGMLVHYSGTVAAAIEATLNGVPALAVSLGVGAAEPDFSGPAAVTAQVAQGLLENPLGTDVVLNVNFPRGPRAEWRGLCWCRLSKASLDDSYERRLDPRGRPYYWLSGDLSELTGDEPEDDLTLLRDRYVTVTPLQVDWTAGEALDARAPWSAALAKTIPGEAR